MGCIATNLGSWTGCDDRTTSCWLQLGTTANGLHVKPDTVDAQSFAVGTTEATIPDIVDLSAQVDSFPYDRPIALDLNLDHIPSFIP